MVMQGKPLDPEVWVCLNDDSQNSLKAETVPLRGQVESIGVDQFCTPALQVQQKGTDAYQ